MYKIFAQSYIFKLIGIFCCIVLFSCKKENSDSETPVYKVGALYATRGFQPGIFDQQGRRVLLRGVNYNVLGDYWQGNPNIPATANYDESQLKLMASYGFNCIRLIFSWSKLEPQPNQYDMDYMHAISQVIQDAEKYGLYIILDLHQDAYSKNIFSTVSDACSFPQKGWDGAPLWATLTDDASVCSNDGSRENVPAVIHAWENLWDNKDGIRDHLINAWSALVAATGYHENLIGYDIINEPSLGYSDFTDQQNRMGHYYTQVIQSIRATESQKGQTHKIIFFEPAVTAIGQSVPAVVGSNFTYDNNIVFAPHNYFEVITDFLTIEQGYSLFDGLASSYKTSCFIGEWGVYTLAASGIEKMKRFAQQEDKYFMGSTFWQWCQAPGDPHGVSWNGNYSDKSLHLIELDKDANYTGVKNDIFLKILSRPRPLAVYGKKIKFSSDSDSGIMELSAEADTIGTTELWIPNIHGTPKISGENIELKNLNSVEGGYKAEIEVQSSYSIQVKY